MKTALDPRHRRRQKLVQELFKIEFHKQNVNEAAKTVLSHTELIDKQIEKAAVEFPIKKINKIDLAILRLAVYELLIEKRNPPKVIIDEAIELAKEYGGGNKPGVYKWRIG